MRVSANRKERVMDHYPFGGRLPIALTPPERDGLEEEGRNHWSLIDYSRPVAILSNYICGYCGLDMRGSFSSFLCGTLEHVVPRYARELGFDSMWIENDANTILACRSCNTSVANPREVKGYLRSVVPEAFPLELLRSHINDPTFLIRSKAFEGFMNVRDTCYDLKRLIVERKRIVRQQEFESLKCGRQSGNATADRKWDIAGRTQHNCALCTHSLRSNLDNWLSSEVEHLVPRGSVKRNGYAEELIESPGNLVIACGMCNRFAQDKQVEELLDSLEVPRNAGDFDDVVREFIELKRTLVRDKRRKYMRFYNRRVRKYD